MKKNISINISGIIFHIEEDGFEQLKKYLDSITRYFSSFEDANEITSDIEGRIAEIFLSKLTEEKQVITSEDVGELVATMGSIEDFQAIEDAGPQASSSQKQYDESFEADDIPEPPRQLKRDNTRKLLGGVCAGIAHYFNIDPLWIRLITLILFIGSYGILLVVYAVMWIVLPSTDEITENKKMKKMFRNPEDKVIAGVSSGIATYFGVDLTLIRVLFVIFGVWGPGVIAYIILWIILPEARTITEKVQMQGEPVTLSNIESNVKKGLNVGEGEKENLLVRILLFPFRLIAAILSGIGKALGPIMLFLVDFIRILTGVFLTVIGIVAIFSVLVVGGVLMGIITGGVFYSIPAENLSDISQPLLMLFDTIPSFTVVVAFLVSIVPPLVLILLGVSIIAKKIVFNATVGWTLFGIFIIGGIFLSINIPGIVYTYHEDGTHEEKRNYTISENTAILMVDRGAGLQGFDNPDFSIVGYEGSDYEVILEFNSQGISRSDAIENAQMVSYGIEQEDSILTFDNNMEFKSGAKYKFQHLDLILRVPYNAQFVMDNSLRSILSYRALERYGYRRSQVNDENVWIFTEDGLECLTCDRADFGFEDANRGTVYSRLHDISNTSSIEVRSPISIEIRQGDEYKLEVLGQERYVDDVNVTLNGEVIELELNDSRENTRRNSARSRDAIKVKITMPDLDNIELMQASKADVRGFEVDDLTIHLSGASNAEMDIDANSLDVNLEGGSTLRLLGESDALNLRVNGKSEFEGYSYRCRTADVRAYGVSSANLYVRDQIRIDQDAVSNVRFRGGATEIDLDDQ